MKFKDFAERKIDVSGLHIISQDGQIGKANEGSTLPLSEVYNMYKLVTSQVTALSNVVMDLGNVLDNQQLQVEQDKDSDAGC